MRIREADIYDWAIVIVAVLVFTAILVTVIKAVLEVC